MKLTLERPIARLAPLCVGLTLAAALALGCDGESKLALTFVDADTNEPIPHALVSGEVGGIYVKNDDTSKGSPAYELGGRADENGKLTLVVPNDQIGLHAFADGYRYAPRKAEGGTDTELTIAIRRQLPEDFVPTLTAASIDPPSVAPGGSFTITVTAAAGSPDDPLSDETLAILDGGDFSVALDPPSAGVQGVGFPDGVYQKKLEAPAEPGLYVYYLVATSEHCVTSDAVALELTVR